MLAPALTTQQVKSRPERRMWPLVGCDAVVKVEYVLAPATTEQGSKEPKGKWHERVLYVQGVSGDHVHSPECDLAVPVRVPVLELHPNIHAQVLRFLRVTVTARSGCLTAVCRFWTTLSGSGSTLSLAGRMSSVCVRPTQWVSR